MKSSPALTTLCAGYESGSWRARQLVDDVMGRHLVSFALSFTDRDGISDENAAWMLKKAANAIYDTNKYHNRGEFGELLLHAAVKDFFDAQPAISKIHFKDSPNDTVKGFDCVHIVECEDKVELWLGEVKFYKRLAKAIADVTFELTAHLNKGFLDREFIAITNKLDPNWPLATAVSDLLDHNRSLDEIIDHLVVPVMLTYDSAAVGEHRKVTADYTKAIEQESTQALANFNRNLSEVLPVKLHLILVPLEKKDRLVNLFHEKLGIWKHL
ncbi:HamA C-terminal domain-containing protein [Corynebacterium amycolatum]|uniref:HamA C-terminal domain-containing protein n=1 Tax=Corynebacterium amycolatum TaxID=43765 RepID=UPI003757E5F6